MATRVFSQEELKAMGARTLDALTKALEERDVEGARKLATQMYDEFSSMHHLYVDWIAGLMDYLYKNHGDEALYEALREVIGASMKPMVELWRMLDFRAQVQMLAMVLRGHLESMRVEEDDEKVCIIMQPCGSGQRLCEGGAYEAPRNLTMIQRPHPMTWNRKDFPIYCAHSPVGEILSIEALGYPAIVAHPPEKVGRGQSCAYCIYKNPNDIPEEVYTRVGKEKPAGDIQ
jgi:hypothetical protein